MLGPNLLAPYDTDHSARDLSRVTRSAEKSDLQQLFNRTFQEQQCEPSFARAAILRIVLLVHISNFWPIGQLLSGADRKVVCVDQFSVDGGDPFTIDSEVFAFAQRAGDFGLGLLDSHSHTVFSCWLMMSVRTCYGIALATSLRACRTTGRSTMRPST